MPKIDPNVKKMFNKYFEDNCIYYAAASVFFLVTCFLPFLLILLNILTLFPVKVNDILNIIHNSAPGQIAGLLDGFVIDIFEKRSVFITSFSIIFTVYTAGQGFMAIMKAFDTIYGVKVQRTWVIRRLKSTAYTFLFMFVIVLLVIMYVYGADIIREIEPAYPGLAMVVRNIIFWRLLIMPAVLLVMFTAMYIYVPNRKGEFWKSLPGGIVATIGVMLFTWIFSLIVSHSPQFNYMYGSIANVIFTLFWLFAIFLIVFFWFEFNTYIEKEWLILPRWMRISQWKVVKTMSGEAARTKKEADDKMKKKAAGVFVKNTKEKNKDK